MPRLLLRMRTPRGFLTLLLMAASLSVFSQLSVEVEGENIACFGLASGTATAVVADGTAPFSYTWSNGGNTATISNLNAGTYTVVVTDDNGQTGSGVITLTEPTRVTATISDPIECDAPFTIAAEPEGGVVPYTYNWSTGADTRAVSVPAGDYCVTVVDANLCGYVACTTVEENPPSVSLVDVDLLCAGDDDGAITANPAGGVAPYTYQWSTGATTRTITGLEPGVYSVVLTDARGCTATAATTISEPPALSGSISGDNTVCPGEASAFLMIVPSGGTPPYSYNWTPGNFGGQGLGPLPAGTYSVVVTDANGCTLTRSFVVTTSDEVEVEIEGDNILCGENATGTLTASPVSGPVSQYVYEWSTGASGPTITNVGPGTYTVTATDANGCTGTATTSVSTVNLNLTLSATPTSCADENNGTATASPTGGQQPYTYEWSNGGNTATITGLTPGVYGVTVTEAGQAGCKVSGTVEVTSPDNLSITAIPFNVDCAGASNGGIDVNVVGGTAPYSFVWNTGALTEDLNDIPGGTYTVTVTDANGCTESLTITVTEPQPLVISEQITNIACEGDETGRIVVTVSGGTQPYGYDWSNGATTRIISNLDAGDYTVTVTDANDCELVQTFTVTEPPAINVSGIVTDILCEGDNDGFVNLTVSGGSGNFSFSWSNGATTEDLNGVPAGDYTVTVLDANECSVTETFTINEPPAILLSVTPTNVTCAGDNDGAIAVAVTGGTAPYVIRLDNVIVNDGDLDGLSGGTYTISVADNNGCSEATTVVIQEPAAFNVSEVVTPVACAGDATGSINLTVSGATPGYTYAWSNGATTQDIANLEAGDYTVTITDSNGCTYVETFTVGGPSAIMLSGVVTDIICAGDNDGTINITVSGGSGGYSFSWSNGATSEDLSGLMAGDYTVVITDANECTATETFMVSEPDALVLTVTPTNVSCDGGSDGSIAVAVSGGTAPYIITLDDAVVSGNITNLEAGTYTVDATDANGCKETTTVVIQEPDAFGVSSAITPVACLGDASGVINLTVSGATPGYTFSWSNGATTEDISGLTAGDYTVTITDANGCVFTETYTVGSNSAINVTGVTSPADCNGEASGDVNITVDGGSGNYSYQWSNSATTQDLTNVTAGNYTVTVMDANECDAVATFTVTEPDEIELSITAPNITCGGTETGVISVFPSGGTGPYTYEWSNGDTGMTISEVGAGSYIVTVTDANGCTDVTAGIVLGELPQLTCEVVVNQQPTMGDNGSISVEVDGGTIPYTYAWDDNSTNPNRTGLGAGTYSVTVTDANNCTTECMVTLQAFAGIGDFVWQDNNSNGQQDPGEPGLFEYPVFLKNAAGEIIDSTLTDENGFYAFMGLTPGTYSILFQEPPGGNWSPNNTGNDATDSDAVPEMGGMTGQYVLDPGEFDMTVDAGFVPDATGGIADPCNCLNNNTTDLDGQFSEIIEVRAFSGQVWTITAQENMFLLESVPPPGAPLSVPVGTVLEETLDPENPGESIYRYEFLLVDSLRYRIDLTNGAQDFVFVNQCFYPEVRFAELPPEEICRFEARFMLDGFGQINGVQLPGEVIFTIDGEIVTELDPMALPLGTNIITAEFIPDPIADEDGIEICRPTTLRQFILIEDCPAKLGDFVWQDNNANGIQDPGEPGIEGVKVIVTSQDETYMDMAFTDNTGMYMFSVPPGTYKITFEAPEDLLPTSTNSGSNDELDSDMNPSTFMTPFYTVGPDEMDFSIDAGFFNPCIENVNNAGTIASNQVICGPGNAPQPFVEIAPATGGVGEIEYLWMFNTEDSGQDISYWQPIPNTNTPNYTSGPIFETTFFVRCVRRNNCPYIEGNVLTVEVGDDAVAAISAPTSACVGEEVIFQAVNPGTSNVTWSFSGSATTPTVTGGTVATTWQTFGSFSVTLTVVRNGCVSTITRNISIVNTPSRCGGNLMASGTVNNFQARDVMIEWEVAADGTEQHFELERSTDGMNFTPVAQVTTPQFTSGNGMNVFRQSDISPLAGRNFYRVRMLDGEYGDMLSNVIEMQLGEPTNQLGRIFPNPANNGMIHVEMTDESTMEASASVQLYDVRGNTIGARRYLRPGTGVINLNAAGQPAGMYIMRLTVGDRTETHRVILE